ncbi:hypothetical protein [Kocuria rosea]|uniref:hypothetical protein n=1 Tax=Kocuria rosea TaxID=1275 RepID=UPI003D33F1E3
MTIPQLASYVDDTLLKPETSREQIATLCEEARQYGFASVCTNPVWTGSVREQLAGSDVLTCAAVEAGASRIGAGSGPALLS